MRDELLKALIDEYPIGTKIHIIDMNGEPQYDGIDGFVELVDAAGQLHGTWGGCALIPEVDKFTKAED